MADRLIAIIRPDSEDQRAKAQRKALEAAGATQIISFRRLSEIMAIIDRLSPGDTILVTRIDRLARTTTELTRLLKHALAARVTVRSLDCKFNTAETEQRNALNSFFEAVSYYDSHRIQNSLARAAEKGVALGRPSKLEESDWPRVAAALEQYTLREIAERENISPQTLRNFRKRMLGN